MRDVYATLRELVPNLAGPGDAILSSWNDRAEPIWRRGERWVRVEAVTQMQLLVVAGEGDRTVAQRPHALTTDLQPVAVDVAELLTAKA